MCRNIQYRVFGLLLEKGLIFMKRRVIGVSILFLILIIISISINKYTKLSKESIDAKDKIKLRIARGG